MRAFTAVVILGGLLATIGCGRMRARTEPLSPLLEIPPPPPRAIVAVPPEPAPLTSVDVPPAQSPLITPPSTPIAPPPPSAAPRTVREQPPPDQPPPRPVAPENPPAQQLQTTTNVGEVEQRVRTMIAQASRDLNRIDYKLLNPESRAQYDIAKRFVQQAGDALAMKNFVFAGQLADKAATLAGLLMNR